MEIPLTCDVLVVGAGPAGSSAAAAAARHGAATILIESKDRIGERPHCGEFVPKQLFVECGLDRDPIVQAVNSMETFILASGGGAPGILDSSDKSMISAKAVRERTEQASPGYLIDRPRFDRQLAARAAELGALVLASVRLIGRECEEWILRHDAQEFRLRPRFVIAADGALSTVAKILGESLPDVVRGVQVQAPLARPMDKTSVFLDPGIVGGYGWLFPRGNVANVGLGVVQRKGIHPSALLDELCGWLVTMGMVRRGVLARSSGIIPVSGPRPRLVDGNVLFCGDAAGLTHPITGAGIAQAVVSGEQAGRSAALALQRRDTQPLHEYEREVLGRYRGVLIHALAKRRLMMTLWDAADFRETCEQTWIGFKGYRVRVKEVG